MTLAALCVYGNEHIAGERGQGKLLAAETYRQLHTAKLNDYAFGWVVGDVQQSADQRLIWHNGSNTLWYALLALLPERNTVVAITSNDGDMKRAQDAAFQILERFAEGDDAS